jgi:hypothetical protein
MKRNEIFKYSKKNFVRLTNAVHFYFLNENKSRNQLLQKEDCMKRETKKAVKMTIKQFFYDFQLSCKNANQYKQTTTAHLLS